MPGNEEIVNGFVPIECTPGPGGNPWPPQNPNQWLDQLWLNNHIKDSTNNPCVANVLNTIKSISSSLPELLRSVFDTSVTNQYTVTLKADNWGYGETGETIHNFDNFDYKVRINTYYDNSTDLSVACTIFHEIFHCQLLAWFRQSHILNDAAKKRELATKWGYLFGDEITNFDSSLVHIINSPVVLQHQAIATRYRNFIGQALFQFSQARGMSGITLEFCKDLAWSGCQPSRAFQDLPGNGDVLLLINAEKDPDGLLGLTPSPHPSPRGTRCL